MAAMADPFSYDPDMVLMLAERSLF
jgi:hypothetical protein